MSEVKTQEKAWMAYGLKCVYVRWYHRAECSKCRIHLRDKSEYELFSGSLQKNALLPNSNDTNQETKEISTPLSGQNASSSSSVKLRKSTNIFSAIVKKARRKKTSSKSVNDELKNLHIASQNSSCASTLSLGVHAEEVEINCQNFDKKCSQNQEMFWERKGVCSETNTSNHSLVTAIKNEETMVGLPETQNDNQSFQGDIIKTTRNHSENKEVVMEDLEGHSKENTAISSFITFEKPTLNICLADGLQYIQETVNNLQESESHIINLLTKYIKDPSLQKQLLSAVSSHSKLQWDAERRSCSLANDMWMHQLEIGRAQEKILQGTLNSLVKQNRQLQIQNEILYRKHEKAVKMLKGSSEHKSRCQEHDSEIDSILRHNEKLQVKLETAFKKCESLEGELLIFQKQNDNMEQQLRNSTVKMQNMKTVIHKLKTEYELEQAALNFKLETKEQILNEALEAGDIVLEDLDGLKRQLKNMPFGLNWSKFKVRGNCLTDLIHMCRSCINELSKEVLNMHTEIALKDKDILTLRETNTKLQENLKKSTNELDVMSKKIEENFATTTGRLLSEQKCQMLENELKSTEEKIDTLKFQIEEEKSFRVQNVADLENHKREIQEKDKMIEQTKMFIASMTSENYSLKSDMAALHRLFRETGAGDVIKEMESNQEEIQYFQKELKRLEKEKRDLTTQMESVQKENSVLLSNQETAYKNLQKQIKELERMSEEIQILRQKADAEHQTVLSLQNERMRYLEEKNILKSIIQHLKIEMSKMKQLEENLENATKEANKLGFAAEYNKQQGEKLKKEVAERDSLIAELKTSVHKLNELQMQNAKEKISLCYELNEVCQLKQKLNDILNTEVKKNEELGQSKEAIVKSVNSQMQKLEEKQRNERTAIKILLKDIKIIAEEKEQLSKEKDKLQLQTEQINAKLREQERKCNEVTKDGLKKDQEIAELRKDRDNFEKKLKEISEKLENDQSKYELNINHLKKLIEQLRMEKKDLESSIDYLKNTIEKLHKDLNLSRQNEKTITDTLNKTKQQQEDTQKNVTEHIEIMNKLTKEKEQLAEEKTKLLDEREKLIKEANYLNKLVDKVVNDFEESIKCSEEKERTFKKDLDESKSSIQSYTKEIEELNRNIELKEKKIGELSDMARDEQFHQKRYIKLKEENDNLEIEHARLKETKMKLENQLSDLEDAYEKSTEHLKHIEKDAHILESQLKIVLDQKEEDYVFYKKHISELLRTRDETETQHQKEIQTLKQQLQDVTNKIVNEKAAYDTLSQIHKEVSGKFMKGIKDLVEVKNSKQEIVEKLKENQETINDLENDNNELHKEINKLSNELEKSKNMVIQLNDENTLLQKSYSKALDKCVSLEHRVKQAELEHHQDIEVEEIENSKKELEKTIHQLKMEISGLQQEITLLQIERSEITLEVHETKKKLETEKNLSEQLRNTHKLLLAAVLQLKDEGKVDPADCIHLLHMVRSSSSMTTESATERN